jgi:hypothetical protein
MRLANAASEKSPTRQPVLQVQDVLAEQRHMVWLEIARIVDIGCLLGRSIELRRN